MATAARPAAAWAKPGIPRSGLKPTNTTRPPPPGIIERVATARVTLQSASTVTRSTARQPLVGISSAGALNCPPALLTSTSRRAEALERRVDDALDLVRLAQVGGDREAVAAAASISARIASSGSARRPQTTTRAPLAASSSAVARPIPVPPPVTSATRPALASAASGDRRRQARCSASIARSSSAVAAREPVERAPRRVRAARPARPARRRRPRAAAPRRSARRAGRVGDAVGVQQQRVAGRERHRHVLGARVVVDAPSSSPVAPDLRRTARRRA